MTLFRTLVLGHIRHNGLRTLVTLFAVGLGVAISLAVDLANATAVDSFSKNVNLIANHVNLQVLGIGRGFDERTLLRVQGLDGVRDASPVIEDALVAGAHPDDPMSGEILHVLGVDLLRPLPHDESQRVAAPGAYDAAEPQSDPYRLIGGRGAIVSQRVAGRYHLQPGSTFRALAGDRPVRLKVVAIFPPSVPGIDSSVVFVDIATAQEIFGKVGLLDRIDLVVDPARIASIRHAVEGAIPFGTRVIEPKVRTAEIQRMLRSFALNLAALSYVAMLVGMYLIYNTVAISVVQRRPEIGTVRALGATRRQIFATFLAEGVAFGVCGSLVGLALGAFLAQFSVGAVAQTVDTLYVGTHVDRVDYAPLLLVKALLLGIVLAALSALAPALEAARTLPAITMRAAGYESRAGRPGIGLALAGLVAFVLAGFAARLPAVDSVPVFGYACGLLIVAGASLCMPLVVARAAALLRALTGKLSPCARLAAANLGAAPRRTAVAVAALMVAIGMMVSVAILIGSFRATVVAWADETLRADLFVRPLGLVDASIDSRFAPRVATKIAALPGVAAVDTLRAITIPFHGSLTTLAATDLASLVARKKVRFIGNVDAAALARTLPSSDRVLVSDPFATRFNVFEGDTLRIETPSGPVDLKVAALYNDYSSDGGIIILDSRTFTKLFHDASFNSLAIYAEPGTDLQSLRSRVIRRLFPLRVDVQTTRELRKLVITIFNRTFAITYALYVISIAIAVLGIVSTLFALVLERRREIGLMRYLGLRASEVRTMILYEAAYIGALGGSSGIAVGILLALLLIFVINRQAFGWLIELHMPWEFLATSFGLVIVAALLAGLYPARVAARIRTAEAVRTE